MGYGKLYPTVKTTPSPLQFCKSFINVWKSRYGEIPNENSCYVMMAKFGLETGFGVNCYNWNLGNIKKVVNDNHQDGYMQLNGVWEIVNGKKTYYPKEAPQSYFRNYPTLDAGMNGYFDLVSSPRYAKAFIELKNGNPEAYSKALKAAGYYTAPEPQYTAMMKGMFNKYKNENHFQIALNSLNSEQQIPKEPENNGADNKQTDNLTTNSKANLLSTIIKVVFPIFNFFPGKKS